MYVPGVFASPHDEATLSLIEQNGFAQLVTHGDDGLIATHLPLQLDRARNLLVGHLAGPNPQVDHLTQAAKTGTQVLAMFEGPHGYVSPSWYVPTNKSVPTWNYTAAHVYGVPKLVTAKPDLHKLVQKLASQYETQGWHIDNQDPAYIDMMLGGIVGFEIAIARIEGKFKLSQNRSAADRTRVIDALLGTGHAHDAALGNEMQRHTKKEA